MPSFLQFVILLILVALVPHSIKRRKETDALGNATLRYFGPALFTFLVGLFFLYQTIKNQSAPFYQLHPENIYTELFFCFFGLLTSTWFFFAKATLTGEAIEHRMWPFVWRYPLAQLSVIEEKQFVLVRFKDGRRFAILPFVSGQQYFLERLERPGTSVTK